LPLPDHIDERLVLDLVSAKKDVDGLSLENIGRVALTLGRGLDAFHGIPCTPRGIMKMLQSTGESLSGKHAVGEILSSV
jgi:methylenetetrahydrofolate dehydrogenase (NADP+)/methenyltetrahydrofolate cyclohydrolase